MLFYFYEAHIIERQGVSQTAQGVPMRSLKHIQGPLALIARNVLCQV